MSVISSILVGTGNGCTGVGYVAPQKKLTTMNSSDLTAMKRLYLGAKIFTGDNVDYQQYRDYVIGTRLNAPIGKQLGQNFQ